ncbi:hypothetical protein PCASD_13228 [Puccinia coronata f. sp. avenae]|uniref:Uncharacterized protein n=1 Tax=Puccinia coronata f. sp. avenae TaxID=200324 RepID=A0A2N5UGC4_9BASI|nr:hypothetical protein PCASD_13228 [Puccinia coronata f. sp. avenae]
MTHNQSSHYHGHVQLPPLGDYQPPNKSNLYNLHQGYPPHQYPRNYNDINEPTTQNIHSNPYQYQTQPSQFYNNQCPEPFRIHHHFESSPDYSSRSSPVHGAPNSIAQVAVPVIHPPPPGFAAANQTVESRPQTTGQIPHRLLSTLPASGQLSAHSNTSAASPQVQAASGPQNPTAEEELRGSMTMNTESTDGPTGKQPRVLSAETKERICTYGLTRFWVEANANITHSRLTTKIKAELDKLYYGFQCEVHQLAIDHGVGPHLLYEQLGWLVKKRGTTSYNNYAEYDPEASKLFAESNSVYQLWDMKDQGKKDRYCDMDFIKQLVDGRIEKSKSKSKGIIQSSNQKESQSVVSEWVRKAMIDLKSISFFHQVEGFVVLASRHPKSNFFCKQGTPLASEFLNMYTGADDPLGNFHTWVAGKAIEKAKKPELQAKSHVKYKKAVVPAHEWDEGRQIPNVASIRRWLRRLMYEASNGDINESWPAKETAKKLLEWKLNFVIEPNVHNITIANFQQPLCKLSKDESTHVLELLGTEKIEMTYTGKKLNDLARNNNRPNKKRKRAGDPTPATASAVATSSVATGSQSEATSTADRRQSQSISAQDRTTNDSNGQAASAADGRPEGSGGSNEEAPMAST